MHDIDISNVTVQVWGGHRPRWDAGEKLHHYPPKQHNMALLYHLWMIQQGRVEILANGKRWQIESGEACLLPIYLERDIVTPQPASWLSLRLWITAFQQFNVMQNVSLPAQWRLDEIERTRMESWMEQIISERHLEQAHYRLTVSGLAQALLGLCWPHLSSASLASSIHSELPGWLAQTLRRVSIDPTYTVAKLAHEAGFSPSQFRRAFYQYIGTSPRDYLISKRLDTARHYLEYSDLSMRAIAMRIGLHDASHFSQVFKDAYGLSPSHYRVLQNAEGKSGDI